jgi:hypothetical protein
MDPDPFERGRPHKEDHHLFGNVPWLLRGKHGRESDL